MLLNVAASIGDLDEAIRLKLCMFEPGMTPVEVAPTSDDLGPLLVP